MGWLDGFSSTLVYEALRGRSLLVAAALSVVTVVVPVGVSPASAAGLGVCASHPYQGTVGVPWLDQVAPVATSTHVYASVSSYPDPSDLNIYSADGVLIKTLPGTGLYDGPLDVAYFADSSILVVQESWNGPVLAYSPDGVFMFEFAGLTDDLLRVTVANSHVYIVDGAGVKVFSRAGALVTTIVGGEDVVLAKDGRVIVLVGSNYNLYDAAGTFINTFSGVTLENVGAPHDFEFEDSVFAIMDQISGWPDPQTWQVKLFDADATYVKTLGDTTDPYPYDIGFYLVDGRIYVGDDTDDDNVADELDVYTSSGTFLHSIASSGAPGAPRIIGQNVAMWTYGAFSVSVYGPDGSVVGTIPTFVASDASWLKAVGDYFYTRDDLDGDGAYETVKVYDETAQLVATLANVEDANVYDRNWLVGGDSFVYVLNSGADVGWNVYGCDPPPPVLCNGAVATVVGTSGDDVLVGTSGVDVIHGLGGNDVIRGLGGDDIICGGSGADTLTGGRGHDVLNGGNGTDTVVYSDATRAVTVDLASGSASGRGNDTIKNVERIVGSDYRDTLVGDSGRNKLWGGSGSDVLMGGGGKDWLFGEKGADTLRGNGGGDVLKGNRGPDKLIGGTGVDTLNGGPGTDSCDGETLTNCEK